jgi:hypothetical protein
VNWIVLLHSQQRASKIAQTKFDTPKQFIYLLLAINLVVSRNRTEVTHFDTALCEKHDQPFSGVNALFTAVRYT